jgi:hypothetical protein
VRYVYVSLCDDDGCQGVATLEAALDWLCLNLPPSQLPSKFSSGFQTESVEGIIMTPILRM